MMLGVKMNKKILPIVLAAALGAAAGFSQEKVMPVQYQMTYNNDILQYNESVDGAHLLKVTKPDGRVFDYRDTAGSDFILESIVVKTPMLNDASQKSNGFYTSTAYNATNSDGIAVLAGAQRQFDIYMSVIRDERAGDEELLKALKSLDALVDPTAGFTENLFLLR
jgi:hypothetical protein